MWIAEGNTSFDDCDALTWSLGCTGEPSRSVASAASTSFAFMFDDVPEPVWYTSIGKCASHWPSATSSALAAMASPIALVTFGTSLSLLFTRAASPFTSASARMSRRSIGSPEIGKFSTARWVCAPHLASTGTRTSPIESCSIRYSVMVSTVSHPLAPAGIGGRCVRLLARATSASARSRRVGRRSRRFVRRLRSRGDKARRTAPGSPT